MDLNDILNKTKKRSEQIKIIRKPPSIASTDRPYSTTDICNKKLDRSEPTKFSPKKIRKKPITNWEQTGNKVVTNWEQSGNKIKETGNKVVAQPVTELVTNWEQSGNKLVTKTSFSMLVGLQRSCLLFMYKSCKVNRSKITEPLSLEHIANNVKTSFGTVKTTLRRLVEKNCLIRIEFKNGRGGWSTYELPESIFTELLRQETDDKLVTNWEQTGNKVVAQPVTEPVTTLSSSSSNYINTTTSEGMENLTKKWSLIDIEPLQDIGFTSKHLSQIAQQEKLSTEIVQDSIYAFAFDLKYNKRGSSIKGSPLNFFMGILRNGIPYAPPNNYESPQDREMRIYLERKREIENARLTMEKELINLEFAKWERQQTDEDKNTLLSANIRKSKFSGEKQAALHAYFLKEVWSKKQEDLKKEIHVFEYEGI